MPDDESRINVEQLKLPAEVLSASWRTYFLCITTIIHQETRLGYHGLFWNENIRISGFSCVCLP